MNPLLILGLALPAWSPTQARWDTSELPVPYCISTNATNTNASAAQQRQAVLGGITAWTSLGSGGAVSCTTYTAQAANYSCSPAVNGQDGRFNIFWNTRWTNGSSAIGVTWTTGTGRSCGSVRDDSGASTSMQCRFDSDIEFNDRDYFWTTSTSNPNTDIQSIAVHEYGHFLGLGHCSDNNTCNLGTGVMYAAYAGGTVRVPFNDDVEGVCGLYPGQQGGLGYPCTRAAQCNSGLCIGTAGATYCTQTCGNCPSGYSCSPNPNNPNQNVCVKDNGLDKGLCESCQLNTPGACANNGICIRGLPEQDAGRCVTPCGSGGSCASDFVCRTVQFQGGGTEDYCFPGSSDCNAPGNFDTLQLGQACDGSEPCADGLTCVGICAPSCAQGQACPTDWACEDGFQGNAAFCLPAVGEAETCDGLVTCSVGPCLSSGDRATCFRDCAGNPSACNNAQMCSTYSLQGGGTVSICEPPGVPPNPPDAGMPTPDAGPTPDSGTIDPSDAGSAPDSGNVGGGNPLCACDTTDACDGDGTGALCACDADCGCPCDSTFACDEGCEACDSECICACDQTFACDEGCEACDPECESGCGCSVADERAGRGGAGVFGLAFAALVFVRRRRSSPRPLRRG